MPISKYFQKALIWKHCAVGICHYFACPASEIWFLHLENFLSQLSYRTSSCFSTIAVNMVSTCFHSLLWSWNTRMWRTALYFRLETSVSRKDLRWPCWSPQSDRGWGRGTDGGVLAKHLRWSSADSIVCVAWFDGLDPLKLCNPSASLSSYFGSFVIYSNSFSIFSSQWESTSFACNSEYWGAIELRGMRAVCMRKCSENKFGFLPLQGCWMTQANCIWDDSECTI